MAAFDLPSWLEPKEAPWHALVAGAQVGNQIAANRARNQALYAEVQQNQQRQDLQEREFIAKNEAHTLTNEVIRLKMTNDTHDFEQLRAWWPKFSEATGDGLKTLELPTLRNPDQMQKIVGMVTQKRQAEGVADFAETVGRVDLTTPEGQEEYWGSVERNPAIAGKMGLQNLMQPIKIAEDTKRLRESAAARIDTANRKLDKLSEHWSNQDSTAAFRAELLQINQEANIEDRVERRRQFDSELDRRLAADQLRREQFEAKQKQMPVDQRLRYQNTVKALQDESVMGKVRDPKTNKLSAEEYQRRSKAIEDEFFSSGRKTAPTSPPRDEGFTPMFDKEGNKVSVPSGRLIEFKDKGYRMAP